MSDRGTEEFDAFAVAAWPRLRWTAYLLCGDRHLAEDLAQTALVRTYARWSKVRRGEAHAYARRTLVNLNIDRLRRRRWRDVEESRAPESATASGTAAVEDTDLIVRLLGVLSPQERRVLVLRHYCDLSEQAVAVELGIALGTVKSTCSRALAKVRAHHPDLIDEGQLR